MRINNSQHWKQQTYHRKHNWSNEMAQHESKHTSFFSFQKASLPCFTFAIAACPLLPKSRKTDGETLPKANGQVSWLFLFPQQSIDGIFYPAEVKSARRDRDMGTQRLATSKWAAMSTLNIEQIAASRFLWYHAEGTIAVVWQIPDLHISHPIAGVFLLLSVLLLFGVKTAKNRTLLGCQKSIAMPKIRIIKVHRMWIICCKNSSAVYWIKRKAGIAFNQRCNDKRVFCQIWAKFTVCSASHPQQISWRLTPTSFRLV